MKNLEARKRRIKDDTNIKPRNMRISEARNGEITDGKH